MKNVDLFGLGEKCGPSCGQLSDEDENASDEGTKSFLGVRGSANFMKN